MNSMVMTNGNPTGKSDHKPSENTDPASAIGSAALTSSADSAELTPSANTSGLTSSSGNTDLTSDHHFVRDRLTWMGYLLCAVNNFFSCGLGALMPSLRADLQLDYTVAAFHFSALAMGSITSGALGDKIMYALGRRRTIWCGAAGVVTGVLLLIFGRHPAITIFGTFFAGVSGSTMGQCVNTIMSDRFQEDRALGIFENNIIAALTGSMSPFAISLCVRASLGWRTALVLPLAAFGILALAFRKTAIIPEALTRRSKNSGALPIAYWAYWLVVGFFVACEWSLVFWSADFLEHVGRLTKADASAASTAFPVAMLIGRIIGRRLAESVPIHKLIPFAALLCMAGFLVFWLGPSSVFNIAGLFVAGLGMANMYPLSFAAGIGTAPEQAGTATSRMSLATGTAILVVPLVLGMVADRTNIYTGYGIVAVLLVLGLCMVVIANNFAQRQRLQAEADRRLAEPAA
jgi:fucose permease